MILFSWLSKLRQGSRRSRLQSTRRTAVEVPVQERGRKFAKYVEEFESRRVLTHVPTVTFTVNTLADTVDVAPGDGNAADGFGNTSLRAAIQEANEATTDVVIVLGANTYTLTRAGDLENKSVDGDLDITNTSHRITIRGAAGGGTTLDANMLDRALHILPDAELTLENVTITNGRATSMTNKQAGALLNEGSLQGYNLSFTNNEATEDGGAVLTVGNSDTLFDSVTFANNKTQTVGGAIANNGKLSFTNGKFDTNQADIGGGAIDNFSPGELTVVSSLFDNNGINAAGSGAAIRSLGQATIRYSTFTNQFAPFGGGVAVLMGSTLIDSSTFTLNDGDEGAAIGLQGGTVEVVNSTIGNNASAGSIGGVIRADGGKLIVRHSTIYGNDSTNGDTGGISLGAGATAEISYSIIASNTSSSGMFPDVSGSFISLGSNFIGDGSGATGFVNGTNFDQVGTNASPLDPQLNSIANNGGATLTYLPQAGSPVVNAGGPSPSAFPERDQRGATRVSGTSTPTIDIGAVETGFTGFFVNTFDDTVDDNPGDGFAVDASGKTSLRAAIMEANSLAGTQNIVIAPGFYALSLTGADENAGATGDLDLFGDIELYGFTPYSTTISAQGSDRVFHLVGSNNVLAGLTITGGATASAFGGGGVLNAGTGNTLRDVLIENNSSGTSGGGVASTEDGLLIENSTLRANTASLDGGGLFTPKSLTLRGITFEENFASRYGGGLASGGSSGGGNVEIMGGTFRFNEADQDGGGLAASSNTRLTINDATISDNYTKTIGGGLSSNNSTVQISRSTISSNQALNQGGGLSLLGPAQLVNVTIKSNSTSTGDGGGLRVAGTGVEVRASEISHNTAANGGGIVVTPGGVLSLIQSTVAENTATNGGGIASSGTLTITNSTISANNASMTGLGGGIAANNGSLDILNSTIATNSAGTGGGLMVSSTVTTPHVANTIIAKNVASANDPDVFNSNPNISLGHNLIGVGTTGFANGTNSDQVGNAGTPLDPKLGALGNNGGPTRTHNLQSGSPAIGNANTSFAPNVDQRGVSRAGRNADVGAYQTGGTVVFVTTTSDTVDAGDDFTSLREAILQANQTPGDEEIVLSPGLYQITQSGVREGLSQTGDFDIADPRLNFVDSGYGTSGTASANVGATGTIPALNATALQNDGKIVAVGSASGDFKIVRFNADGSIDNSFGTSGIATLDFTGFLDVAEDVAIDANGKIVVAGWTTGSSGFVSFAVARFNSDGTLDSSFNSSGTSGYIVFDFDPGNDNSFAKSVTIDSNDKIVVAGHRHITNDVIALARLNSDGTLDTSFNSTGQVVTPTPPNNSRGNSVIQRSTGGYLVAGLKGTDFVIVAYDDSGAIDTAFGNSGLTTVHFNAGASIATSIVERTDGRFLVAGQTPDDYAIVLLNSNGSINTEFGNVLVSAEGNAHQAGQLALLDDGRFALAATQGNSARLLRFGTTGDLEFSTTQSGSNAVFGLDVVGSSNSLHFATSEPDGTSDFAITRYSGSGTGGLSIYGFDASGTTIDGQQLDRLFDVQPHAKLTLEGVELRNGTAMTGTSKSGGAIQARNAGLVLTRTTLSGNQASEGGGAISIIGTQNGAASLSINESIISSNKANIGGAISDDRANINIQRTLFDNNEATNNNTKGGGAISANRANVSVSESYFSNNKASGTSSGGGAVYLSDGGAPTMFSASFNDTTFSKNSAGDEGGAAIAIFGAGMNANVSDSEFSENSTIGPGGGLQVTAGNVAITNTRFMANKSISGANEGTGGGFALNGGTAAVSGSEFFNNTVDGPGGAIFSNGSLTISRSTIAGNQARNGGGYFQFVGNADITNSTFSGNSSIEEGGAIKVDDGSASLLNVTITGNAAGTTGGGLYRFSGSSGSVTLQNTILAGNSASSFADYDGALTSFNGNLIGDADGHTDFSGSSDIVGGQTSTTISNATNASPIVITSASHGLISGDRVRIRGAVGNDGANGVFSVRVLDSNSFELIGSSGTGNYTSGGTVSKLVDPKLGVLQDNTTQAFPPSAPRVLNSFFASAFAPFQLPSPVVTQTHALQFGSPAIDAGENTNAPSIDQRGITRPQDALDNGSSIVDIGAFERRDADVAGAVFIDANGNGIRDVGEGLLNSEFGSAYLDVNRNGRRDGDEPIAITRLDDPATPQNEAGYILSYLTPGTDNYIGASVGANRRITSPKDILFALQSTTTFNTGDGPTAIAAGDINGDNFPDLVVALTNSNMIAVLRTRVINNSNSGLMIGGSPAFEYMNPLLLGSGATPADIKLADLTGDGVNEILVVNKDDNSIDIFSGGTSIGYLTTISTGSEPRDVEVADMNNDGKLDLVVAERMANQVRVYRQTGAATFDSGTTIGTGTAPRDLVVGDFNGDHRADVAVGYEFDDTIQFLMQEESGSFTPQTINLPTNAAPQSLAASDLDLDGDLDLIVGEAGIDEVRLIRNIGSGASFQSIALGTFSTPSTVKAVDLNGDRLPDIVIASDDAAGSLSVLPNMGSLVSTPIVISSNLNHPSDFAIADTTGDGRLDIITANLGTDDIATFSNLTGDLRINPATGALVEGQNIGTQLLRTVTGMVFDDVDGDGAKGVAEAGLGGVTVYLDINNNGQFDSFEPSAISSTASIDRGTVTFQNVAPGDCRIGEVTPPNRAQTAPHTLALASTTLIDAASSHSIDVISADVNGDNKLDVISLNRGNSVGSIQIKLNTGTTEMLSLPSVTVGELPQHIAAGDIDNDGDIDFAITEQGNNRVQLLLNDGTGTLSLGDTLPANDGADHIALADLDHNGTLDLIANGNLSGTTSNLRIHTGNGAGSFDSGSQLDTGSDVTDFIVTDINNDAFPDIAVSHANSHDITFFRNTPTGFTNAGSITFGSTEEPQTLLLRQVDGRFGPELYVLVHDFSSAANFLKVFRSNGDFNFTNTATKSLATQSTDLALGDFNHDGTGDVAVSNESSSPSVSILLGTNNLNYDDRVDLPTTLGVSALAVGHFDGDDLPDIAATEDNATTGRLTLLFNRLGTSVIHVDSSSTVPNFEFGSTELGTITGTVFNDVDRDDSLDGGESGISGIRVFIDTNDNGIRDFNEPMDLTKSNGSYTLTGVFPNQPQRVVVERPNGFNFSSPQATAFLGGFPYAVGLAPTSITLADLDNDGDQDGVLTNFDSDSITLLINNKGSYLTPEIPVGDGPQDAAIADVNGDGIKDIVVANAFGNEITVLLGLAVGGYATGTTYAVGESPSEIVIGDFNNDNKPDVAVVNANVDQARILTNDGTGAFTLAATINVGDEPRGLVAADFNNDGKLDFATSNVLGDSVTIALNQGGLSFSTSSEVVGDAPDTLRAGDLNKDGNVDLLVSNRSGDSISVLINNGNGTFNGTAPITFFTGSDPVGFDLGDYDNDGDLDLAVILNGSDTIGLYKNDGTGFYTLDDTLSGGVGDELVFTDINGDRSLDIATINSASSELLIRRNVRGTPTQSVTAGGTTNADFALAFTDNIGPSITSPASGTTNEDTALVFKNSNAITITDSDAGSSPLRVILRALNGTSTLSQTTGLTFSLGDGIADPTLSFTGSQADINAALDGLTFTPNAEFAGSAALQIDVDDLGNTGTGSNGLASQTIGITVNASPADYGDAPAVYPQQAHHDVGGPSLGTAPDVDAAAHPSGNADGDDTDNTDDEDGVTFLSSIITSAAANNVASVLVNLQNASTAKLDAFIDFNHDGDWTDPGEQVATSVTLTAGDNILNFVVPAGSSTGTTFARFRVSTNGGLDAAAPANDGEIEDYAVTIIDDSADATITLPAGGGHTTLKIASGNRVISRDGKQLFSTPNSGKSKLTIAGTSADDDRLIIDFANGNPLPTGGVVFDGGTGGNDALTITGGSANSVTHKFANANDGSVSIGISTSTFNIDYVGLEPIFDDLNTADRVFEFSDSAETITLSDDDIGTMFIDSTLGESVVFTNPTTSLTIRSGDGDDVINLNSFNPDFSGSLLVEGQSGNDTVSFNGNANLGSINVTSEFITFASSSISTLNTQTYNGEMTLASDVQFADAVSSTITFNGTIDGAKKLRTVGAVVFNGVVGGTTPLSKAELVGDFKNVTINQDFTVGSGGISSSNINKLTVAGKISSDASNIALGAFGDITFSGATAGVATNGGTLTLSADNDSDGTGAIIINNSGAALSTSDGDVVLFASDMTILGTIDAGSGNITIDSKNNRAIDLGTETTGELSLTDSELDQLSGAMISIGSAATTGISITSAITRASLTDMSLIVGNATIDFTGGSFNTNGGSLAITASGNGSIEADAAGTDIFAGQLTLSAGDASGVSIGTAANPLRLSVTDLTTDTATANGDQFLIEEDTLSINGTGLDAGTGTIHLLAGGFEISADDLIADASSLEVDGNATFDIDSFNDTLTALALLNGTLDGTTGTLTSTVDYDIRKGTINAQLAGTVALLKTTTNTVTINSANTYSGGTNLLAGLTLINGSVAGALLVDNSATLGGTGTTGNVTMNSGGSVAPGNSPGILNVGDVTFTAGSTLSIEANSSTVGSGYDQLDVTGTVSLGNATLNTSGTISSSPGQVLTIIQNDGVDPVGGTFAGLGEGAIVSINGVEFVLSYTGGSGNDVTLSQTSTVSISALSATNNEGNAGTTDFTFTVTRTGSATAGFTIDYAVTGFGTNPADATDFDTGSFPSGTLTFAANEVSQTLTIKVQGDTTFEFAEGFRVTLSSPSTGVSLGTATADGTIQNDDDAYPINDVPATQTVDEDSSLVFSRSNNNGISISDADAGSSDIQVTLAITSGTLTLSSTTGLTFTTGDGTADSTITFKGAIAAINTAIEGLTFTPTPNFHGAAYLTVDTDDLAANNFSGQNRTASDSVQVTVTSINDGPTITAPTSSTTDEDTALVFNSANGNAISIDDIDAGSGALEITFTATNGTITLASTTNLTFTSGDGTSDATMTLQGTLADINAALNGLSFTPSANVNGSGSLDINLSDLGNSGVGGALTSSASIGISINSINDNPTISAIAGQTTNEDTATGTISFTVNDVETSAANLTVTATSSNTSLVPAANIQLSGSGSSRGLIITPLANQSGTTTITLTVTDADGGTSTSSFVISVTAVNDAPTITAISDQTIDEDTSTSAISFTINDIDDAIGDLVVSVTSTDTGLIPVANVVVSGTGSSRTVTVTPAANGFGSSTVTITVTDLANASASESFVVNVTSINDAPTIGTITDQTIDEDTNTGDIAFSVGDIETAAGNLVVFGSSSNTSLVPGASIFISGSGANRTVRVTPTANQSGTTTITLTVNDADGGTSTSSFLLTVNAIDDAPTITAISDQSIDEDTDTGALNFSINDIDDAISNLSVTATTSNATLIPLSNIVISNTGAARTVTVTPTSNESGSATITLTVTDPAGATSTETFVVTVAPINDAPFLGLNRPADITIDEDTDTGDVSFTANDIDNAPADLTVTGTSSNTTLVPNGNIVITGTGTARTLKITPFSDRFGTTTITLTITDAAGLSTHQQFLLTVNSVNDAPMISMIGDQTTDEDTSTGAINFNIGDIEDSPSSLLVAVSSSNAALIPNANITLSGSGANRSLTVTPVSNQFGTSTITLTVTDSTGATTTESFLLTVNGVNDLPTISSIADQTIDEDNNTGNLSFNVGDVESSVATLSVTATSSNTSLVPNGAITLSGTGATRTVRVTPTANASGTATITLTVQDADGGTSQQSFLLTVNPVNDAPTISNIADQTIDEDQMTSALGFLIGDLEDIPDDLTISVSSSNTQLVPTANIIVSGTGANRSVQVTPAANKFGSATITITITDLNGLTASDSFTLTVNPVNDPPVAVDDAFGSLEDVPLSLLLPDSLLVNDGDLESDPLTAEVVTQPQFGTVTVNADGTFTYTPSANFNGIDTFTYRVSDGSLFSQPATVTLTVDAVNDAPQNNIPSLQTIDEDTPLVFSTETQNGITVGDLETGSRGLLEVRLSVTHGTLTLPRTTGLTFTLGDGTDDPAIRIRGLVADLNAALDGLTYLPDANFNGNDALNITTIDQGGTSNGGNNTDTDSIPLFVNPVNDAPRIQLPDTFVTNENQPLVFDPQLGTGIVVIDELGTAQAPNVLHVSLSVGNGKLSLSQTNGLTFGTGDGTQDSEMTFTGTLLDINAALRGARYLPPFNADGTTRLTIAVDDQGNVGSGGPLTTSATRDITVTAVPGIIRGIVWDDTEYDGIRDPINEPGLSGITVRLLDPTGNVIETVTTDASGRYNFNSVLSDSYLVEFEAPIGRHYTDRNVGDERFDSDAHPLTGRSKVIDLNAGDLLLGIDAGLVVTTVSISQPDPVPEGNIGTKTAYDFVVTLNGRSSQAVTVNAQLFPYSEGFESATIGQDLDAFPNGVYSVTFQPEQTQQRIRVAINGDPFIEPDETFEVRLVNATNATIVEGSAIGTIFNDDFASPVVVIKPNPVVIEGQDPQLSFLEYEVLLLGGPVNSDLSISYETADPPPDASTGFATPGRDEFAQNADYLSTRGTATIIAGRTSTKIRIPVIGDRRIEGDETVVLRITDFQDPGHTGADLSLPADMLGQSLLFGTITDDDFANPAISIEDMTIAEGDSPFVTALSFPVRLAGPADHDITLNYSTLAFSTTGAATADSDFTSVTTGTVTIQRGQTVAYITIEVIGDNDIESDETFAVEISSDDPLDPISQSIGIGTITNDDFSIPLVSVTHGVDTTEGRVGQFNEVQFTISLQGASFTDTTVTYSTVDLRDPGSATADIDYVPVRFRQVVIPAGSTSAVVSVTVIGDEFIENDEDIRLRIDNVFGSVQLDNAHAETSATILNDDRVRPMLSVDSPTTVSETDAPLFSAAQFVLRLDGPASTDITVYYRTRTGSGPESATEFFDFVPEDSGSLVIYAGQTQAIISVLILPDDVAEPPERFFLELTGLDGTADLDPDHSRAQAVILDDDAGHPTVSINESVSVTEPDRNGRTSASLTVSLSSATDVPVEISYVTRVEGRPGFATPGIDFTPVTTGTVRIDPGQTSATISFEILGDDFIEDTEHFVVELTGATGGAILQPGSRTARVVILDNDFFTPTVSISDASMVEGDPDDNPTDPYQQRDLAPRLNELVFVITLNGPASNGPVMVDVETNKLTNAPAGLANSDEPDPELANPIRDFFRTKRTLTFDPGVTSQEFRVRVVPDDRFEPDEIFFVRVTNVVNATINGDVLQATGTIYNDDAPEPTLSIEGSELLEGDDGTQFMRFRVALDSDPNAGPATDISVDFTTKAISATAGSDYITQTGTLTFAPGQREQFVDVPIIGDFDDEPDEQFIVELSNPTNGAVLDVTAFQAKGLIRNDDASEDVRFQIDSVTKREGNSGETLFDFTVTKIGKSSSPSLVRFETHDDTATANSDYAPLNGFLTFDPTGPSTQTVTIRVFGDVILEPEAETFFVTLTDAINATVDPAYSQGTGSILNDDQTVFREDGDRELLEIARQIQTLIGQLGNDPGNAQIQALIVQLSRQVLSNLGLEAGLVFIADPVDFLLTDTAGRTNGYTATAGEVTQTPRSYYSGDGNVELVVIPQAPTGVYGLQLSGVGSGEYRTAATLITSDGGAKTIAGANVLQGDVQLALDFTNTSNFPIRDNAISKLADAALSNRGAGKNDSFVLSQEAAQALAMLNDRVDAASDSANVNRLFFGPLLNSLSGMGNAVEQLLGENFSESIKKWNILKGRKGGDGDATTSSDDDASKSATETFWKSLGKTLLGTPSMLLDIIDSIDVEQSADTPPANGSKNGKQAPAKPAGQSKTAPAAQPQKSENAAVEAKKDKSALAVVTEKQTAKRKQQEHEERVARWRFGRGKTPTPWDEGVDLEDRSSPWSAPVEDVPADEAG